MTEEYVQPPNSNIPFGHTLCINELEMRSFNRTVIEKIPRMWICKFCKSVNKASAENCHHCGAPRSEDCKVVNL